MVRWNGTEGSVQTTLDALTASMAPPSHEWFGRRLTVLWTQFMVGRETDPAKTAVWMTETAAHLGDLPHDIVAHAIDQAIRTSPHGFIPSVGEIRKIADPLADERRQQIDRLGRVIQVLAEPSKVRVLSDGEARAMMDDDEFRAWQARKIERTAA